MNRDEKKLVADAASGDEPSYFSRQVAVADRFYRPLLAKGAALPYVYVVAGGKEKCAPSYTISRKTFPFYSIEFVAAGKGSLILGRNSHALVPGAIFSYGPGIAHEIRTSSQGPLEKYFVNFTGKSAAVAVRKFPRYGKILSTSKPNEILNTFEEITKHGFLHSPYEERICGALVELLILKISSYAIGSTDAKSLSFARYQECADLITSNYRSINSLAEIAEKSCLDGAYICRLFKKYWHLTPYQHLTRLKMNAAAEQLLEPGSLVKEVAGKLGFDDQFHFSRTFRRYFKMSPREFVRMHQR